MYEMYPDAWPDQGEPAQDRRAEAEREQPRRRARKEHRVAPRVLRTEADQAA